MAFERIGTSAPNVARREDLREKSSFPSIDSQTSLRNKGGISTPTIKVVKIAWRATIAQWAFHDCPFRNLETRRGRTRKLPPGDRISPTGYYDAAPA